MKKFLALVLALVMVFALCACGAKPAENPAPVEPAEPAEPVVETVDDIPDTMTSADGKYQLAFITDVGQLKDGSFNEGTYNGIKQYAYDNGKSYKYYQPANGNAATDDDRIDAVKAAAAGGAEVIVAAGFMQGNALQATCELYPDVKFVFIDGWPIADAAGNPLKNVTAIAFKEEQCGYFAGYAVVKDGYTKLGFCGGGGNANPACCRFGYGWVQGANAAAAELGVQVEMNYSWEYGASYSASPELQAMANGWFENGTEVIFPCGGDMFDSIVAAAAANDGWCLGVDKDQAKDSDTVLTSATKGVGEAAAYAIGKVYDGTWDEIAGGAASMGVLDNAVGIPTGEASWRFSTFTVEEFNAVYEKVLSGELVIDDQYPEDMSSIEFSNVTVNMF